MPPTPRPPRERYALTRAQEHVWLAEQAADGPGRFTIGEVMEIHGPVDPVAFEAAVRHVLVATEIGLVRFGVGDDGRPYQELDPELPWALRIVDLTADSGAVSPADHAADAAGPAGPGAGDDLAARVMAEARAQLARSFDLTTGEPLVAHTLFLAADRSWWVWTGHHIVADAASGALAAGLVADAYSRLVAGDPLPPTAPGSLARLVELDRAYAGSPAAARDAAWWQERIAGAPEPVRLSRGDPPPSGTTFRCLRALDPGFDARLRASCTTASRRPSAVVTAAVAAYVHRVTGAQDLVLGLPVTARAGAELRSLPGMLSNIVPLRLAVRPETTGDELVAQVGRELQKVALRQRYRGEDLCREAGIPGGILGLIGPSVNFMAFDHAFRFGGHRATFHTLRSGPVDDLAVA
ncbi:MAG TPA: condensation domain-containing protein, partial [Acidimicrobiales bacterium]